MTTQARHETLVCEICGAPLQTAGEGCLNCLLSSGLDRVDEAQPKLPNQSRTPNWQHYEIMLLPDGSLWELGRGSTGVTYKARDVNLGTTVALKIIEDHISSEPDARLRFLREAQAAAQIRHPNVARVFHAGLANGASPESARAGGAGSFNGGECFYAAEFVDGESLETRVRRNGPLALAEALEMAVQVSRALAAAQQSGLIHCGLQPSHIMLLPGQEAGALDGSNASWVKVIDFGRIEIAPGADDRSDIRSLGEILCFALTGKMLAAGEGDAPVSETPAPANQLVDRGVPPSVIALVDSMLSAQPGDGPQSLSEARQALQDCSESLAGEMTPVPRNRCRRWALVGALGAIAAGVATILYLALAASPTEEKSIAVLPFRNLGRDPGNAFLVEGVQDDLISRLDRIRDLKVIDRRGTSAYLAEAPRDLSAIGHALGVRHLLEGSLRREGNRVRLQLSLIDTRNGLEVWSESYDRNLADAINLQGELATDIADALKATLTPRERLDVRSKSTGNPDAYVLYLQGRKLEKNPGFAVTEYGEAAVLYRQAVAIDPGFALAHARLAITLGLLYQFRGPGEELKARAHAEAREALHLDPDLGEGHLALGLCFYRIDRDFDRALRELERARGLLPNDTEAELTIAFIQRRRGEWREALASQKRALARDPLNNEFEHELLATSDMLRDWPDAATHANRAIKLAPQMAPLKAERVLVDLWQKGDLSGLQKFFSELPAYGDVEGKAAWARWDVAMLARDFPKAQAALDGFPFETLSSVLSAPVPKSYLTGCIWLAQGNGVRAQEFFEKARPSMESEILAHPENALRHARLGLLYAYLGRKADALREGKRAAELTPVRDDMIDGHLWLCNLALIHARVGDASEAISMIKRLLREPGCVAPLNESSMTLSELRLRWQWDPLRNDPRFQKILAGPEPPTPF